MNEYDNFGTGDTDSNLSLRLDRKMSTVIFALGLTHVHLNQHTCIFIQVSVHSAILINSDAYKINMTQVLQVHCIAR